MPAARGIACSLKIEDQNSNAPEYDIQCEDLDDFASAYVVAEEGKRFSLEVAVKVWVHSDLNVFVYMDGVYQTGVVWKGISPKDFIRQKSFDCKMEVDKETNQHFEMAWKFDTLAVVDEREADCEKEFRVLSNIGAIEVVVIRCKKAEDHQVPVENIEPHPYSKPYWTSWTKDRVRISEKPPQPQAQPVFEKDIKGRGISHRVTTGPEKKIERKSAGFHHLDSFENPYCILVMQYRSRDALKNIGLIPATPMPSPSPSRSPSPDITQDDLEQMKELSREDMMKELLKYKKQESLMLGKKIKQESREANYEEGRKHKRARRDEKVFIDLTDD